MIVPPLRINGETESLELQAQVDVHVGISFGLEISASIVARNWPTLEVDMENSLAMANKAMVFFWCGIAFLRSSGERQISTQMRDRREFRIDAFQKGCGRFDSSPSR